MRDEADSVIDRVADLWRRGRTQSQIAREIETTPSRVAGLVARARLNNDTRFPLRPPTPKADLPTIKAAPPPAPAGLLLVDLDWRGCRWPVGIAPDGHHLLCGRPQEIRRPYCEAHCAKAPRVSL